MRFKMKKDIFLLITLLIFLVIPCSKAYADWKPVEKYHIFQNNAPEQCKIAKFQYDVYLLKISGKYLTFYKSQDSGKTFDSGLIIRVVEQCEFEMNVDSYGTIHIFYTFATQNGSLIYYQLSKNNGQSFSTPLILTQNLERSSDISCYIQNQNTIFLVFISKIDSTSEIFYVKSIDSGNTFSKPFRVTDNNIKEKYPDIAFYNNTVFIAYQTFIEDDNIYLIEGTNDNFIAPVRVNKYNDTTGNFFDMEINDKGQIYIVFTSTESDSDGDLYLARKTDSSSIFQYSNISDDCTNAQEFPILKIVNNVIYVAWNDQRNYNYDAYISRSTDHGQTFEKSFNVTGLQSNQVMRDLVIDEDEALILVSEIKDENHATVIYKTTYMEPEKTLYSCTPSLGEYTLYDNAVIWAKVHNLQDGSPGIVQFRMAKPDSPLSGGIAQVRMNSISGPVWNEWFYEPGMYTTSPAYSLPLTFTNGTIDFYITVKNHESIIHSGLIQISAQKEDSMPEFLWESPIEHSVITNTFLLKGIAYDENMIKKVTLALFSKNMGQSINIPLYQSKIPLEKIVHISQTIDTGSYGIKEGDIELGIWLIDGDDNTGYNNCNSALTARSIYLTNASPLQILSMSTDKLYSGKSQTVIIEGVGFHSDVTLSIETAAQSEPFYITPFSIIDDKTISCTIPGLNVMGSYTMTISNDLGVVHKRIDLFTVVDSKEKMKAIIVAASQTEPYAKDYLWGPTRLCANYGYQSLLEQGLTRDEIFYLSPETSSIVDDKSSLQALENVLSNNVNDVDRVLLYMVGHGGFASFLINSNEELPAEVLDKWLDNLQEKRLSCDVIIIYDACKSGSFISYLKPPLNNTNRYVITSTSKNENSYQLYQGGLSFSFQFWAYVRYGAALNKAFFFGRDMMEVFQTSNLDANGNGIPNEKEDKSLASHVFIGQGKTVASFFPRINSISSSQVLYEETAANIWISDIIVANDDNEVTDISAFAVIKPPDSFYQDDSSTLPTITLSDQNNDLVFEGLYEHFDIPGEYIITAYVVDSRGQYSEPIITTVYKKTAYTGDMFENDDLFFQASHIDSPQIHDFHYLGDQDWVYFYGLQDKTYFIDILATHPVELTIFTSDGQTVISSNYGISQSMQWMCSNNDIVFIKTAPGNLSVFGKDSQYQLSVYLNNAMDAYENDDTFEQARIITSNAFVSQRHNFHQLGDADWVQFYGVADREYSIEIHSLGGRCDTVLELYDMDGSTLIKSKDDGEYGEREFMRWTCQVSGTYYIKVSSFQSEIHGEDTEYSLRLYYPIATTPGSIYIIVSDQNEQPMKNIHLCIIERDSLKKVYNDLIKDYKPFSMPLNQSLYSVIISKKGFHRIEKEIQILSSLPTVVKERMKKKCAPGDIDGNGKVQLNDVNLAFQIFVGFVKPDACMLESADFDDDGMVLLDDVKAVFIQLIGMR